MKEAPKEYERSAKRIRKKSQKNMKEAPKEYERSAKRI